MKGAQISKYSSIAGALLAVDSDLDFVLFSRCHGVVGGIDRINCAGELFNSGVPVFDKVRRRSHDGRVRGLPPAYHSEYASGVPTEPAITRSGSVTRDVGYAVIPRASRHFCIIVP